MCVVSGVESGGSGDRLVEEGGRTRAEVIRESSREDRLWWTRRSVGRLWLRASVNTFRPDDRTHRHVRQIPHVLLKRLSRNLARLAIVRLPEFLFSLREPELIATVHSGPEGFRPVFEISELGVGCFFAVGVGIAARRRLVKVIADEGFFAP